MWPVALMTALRHPLVKRIMAFVVGSREIRAAFVQQVEKQRAAGLDLSSLPSDAAAIDRLLDEVAQGLAENDALQAEIRDIEAARIQVDGTRLD